MTDSVPSRRVSVLPGSSPLTLSLGFEWGILWLGYVRAWTGAQLALVYNRDAQERQRQVLEIGMLAQEAQMAALRYQISPHFLFNTLKDRKSTRLNSSH